MVYKKQLSITPDKSQSPQTGQFNSYIQKLSPSLQFHLFQSQSPQTGQFNSYGKFFLDLICPMSQSPQTGQFNSYASIATIGSMWIVGSLNPLKRVNSILTFTESENT